MSQDTKPAGGAVAPGASTAPLSRDAKCLKHIAEEIVGEMSAAGQSVSFDAVLKALDGASADNVVWQSYQRRLKMVMEQVQAFLTDRELALGTTRLAPETDEEFFNLLLAHCITAVSDREKTRGPIESWRMRALNELRPPKP
jgi:hypothetical protein